MGCHKTRPTPRPGRVAVWLNIARPLALALVGVGVGMGVLGMSLLGALVVVLDFLCLWGVCWHGQRLARG